jgi:hypothetical protein
MTPNLDAVIVDGNSLPTLFLIWTQSFGSLCRLSPCLYNGKERDSCAITWMDWAGRPRLAGWLVRLVIKVPLLWLEINLPACERFTRRPRIRGWKNECHVQVLKARPHLSGQRRGLLKHPEEFNRLGRLPTPKMNHCVTEVLQSFSSQIVELKSPKKIFPNAAHGRADGLSSVNAQTHSFPHPTTIEENRDQPTGMLLIPQAKLYGGGSPPSFPNKKSGTRILPNSWS